MGGGGRREERGRRKHMDLFKNTAVYQSQAPSESSGASKRARGEKKKKRRRRTPPGVTERERDRDREISSWKERMRGEEDREQKHCRKNKNMFSS